MKSNQVAKTLICSLLRGFKETVRKGGDFDATLMMNVFCFVLFFYMAESVSRHYKVNPVF